MDPPAARARVNKGSNPQEVPTVLLGELITVALQSVRANLFRSILTMLGIIIGVASVITMLAVGAGARGAVDQQIEALGAGLLSIRAGQTMHQGVATASDTLTVEDVAALIRDSTTLSDVTAERSGMEQFKLGNQNANLRVVGASPNFPVVQNYQLQAGRMYSAGDNAAKRALVVVGSKVPEQFNQTAESLLGQTLYIRGLAFQVIGVFSEKGTTGFRNVDEQAWVPLDTARFRLFGSESLDLISAKPLRGVPMQKAIVDVERILRREHRLAPGKDNDFSVHDPRQFLDFQQTAANIFAILLASIASISLLVGGIGIMNITLLSVTERTREIGLRMAVGARGKDVMRQFLFEAVVISAAGGLAGIVVGVIASIGIARLLQWATVVSPWSVALAFGIATAVGVFFGWYPARRASKLDPIVALRRD